MKRFAQLFRELDQHTGTLAKRAAIVAYFRDAPAADAVWALWLLSGNKLTAARARIANATELRRWISTDTGLPDWLVDDSYHHVGDLAETLALLLPAAPTASAPERTLHEWIEEVLLPCAGQGESVRQAVVRQAWHQLPYGARLVLNKILTGSLRIGVSQALVQQALAEWSGLPIARLAQRLLGDWHPTPDFWADLLNPDELPSDRRQPFPFFLASPIEHAVGYAPSESADAPPEDDAPFESATAPSTLADTPAARLHKALGPVEDWLLEWKWDGIRLQIIRRAGEVALWSRGEERLDGRFPEIEHAASLLPCDAVLDGELLAWPVSIGDHPPATAPLPFTALQKRIQRRTPSKRLLAEVPVRALIYDVLELEGEDLRALPLADRRAKLEHVLATQTPAPGPGLSTLAVSPTLTVADWHEAALARAQSRARGVEGLMLKRRTSAYQSGRRRGDWWKWKIDPLTIDAVLIYAQAGHGRRSNLYTDYTFGLWDGDRLVPVAKAYSGLTDREISQLDRWIRQNTLERFGPVRSVTPVHVFELGFEGVNLSSRHKSGVAVRFPRILRWRNDKSAESADQLATLKSLAHG